MARPCSAYKGTCKSMRAASQPASLETGNLLSFPQLPSSASLALLCLTLFYSLPLSLAQETRPPFKPRCLKCSSACATYLLHYIPACLPACLPACPPPCPCGSYYLASFAIDKVQTACGVDSCISQPPGSQIHIPILNRICVSVLVPPPIHPLILIRPPAAWGWRRLVVIGQYVGLLTLESCSCHFLLRVELSRVESIQTKLLASCSTVYASKTYLHQPIRRDASLPWPRAPSRTLVQRHARSRG